MALPDSAFFQFSDSLRICRVLNGMWQVSGTHGEIPAEAAVENMLSYHSEGFTTWDLADHYGPAEDFVGDFRKRVTKETGASALAESVAFTKWVPRPGRISNETVEKAIQVSLDRMGVETLDLLQFHWWEYRDSGYLSALTHLAFLVREGKIRHLGLTNFDTRHLKNLRDNGIRIVSNQVQYSLIDRRPEVSMVKYCKDNDVHLLAYGALAGGLLTDKYLGQPEPRSSDLNTASLRKYKPMIDKWGGWDLFQELLAVLREIANKYNVSIANVAVNAIMDRPSVAGVIVGVRLGVSSHLEETKPVFEFTLDDEDWQAINAVHSRGKNLYKLIGDCGAEYRR